MNAKQTAAITLAAATLGVGGLGAGYAQAATYGKTEKPGYTSSIQVKDRDRDREERRVERKELREAARFADMAKIDATQAISAALAKVPGTVLRAELDNENGNIVYSVAVRTKTKELKDVKVDAGTGAVLHVGAA